MREMTWWQFDAAISGWIAANSSEQQPGMSDDEANAAWDVVRAT